MPSAIELATLLRDFVDVLIPGEGPWPAASVVGVQGVLGDAPARGARRAGRCRARGGAARLGRPAGPAGRRRPRAPWSSGSSASMPKLFTLVRNAATSPTTRIRRSSGRSGAGPALPGDARHRRLSAAAVRPRARPADPRARRLCPHRRCPAGSIWANCMEARMAARDEPADVLIIGSGATGAIAAMVLARGGARGRLPRAGRLGRARRPPALPAPTGSGSGGPAGAPTSTSARHPDDFPVRSNSSQVLMWNGVGGSTNVYGALWPRYRPSDFRKGTEHGLQPDWPISLRGPRPLLRARRPADRRLRPGRRPGDAAAGRLPDPAAAAAGGRPAPRRRLRPARLALVAGPGRRDLARTMTAARPATAAASATAARAAR